jgi:putative transposase
MAIPYRGATRADETYFITFNCEGRKRLLQSQRMAMLLIDVLLHHRQEQKYLLHEFVVMPDHFHALLTTLDEISLEQAVSIIKGALSYRAKRAFNLRGPIWQTSFVDRRVRNSAEYANIRNYILDNPVKAFLCASRQEWPYSSIAMQLDEVPQRLKPPSKKRESCRIAGLNGLRHQYCRLRRISSERLTPPVARCFDRWGTPFRAAKRHRRALAPVVKTPCASASLLSRLISASQRSSAR